MAFRAQDEQQVRALHQPERLGVGNYARDLNDAAQAASFGERSRIDAIRGFAASHQVDSNIFLTDATRRQEFTHSLKQRLRRAIGNRDSRVGDGQRMFRRRRLGPNLSLSIPFGMQTNFLESRSYSDPERLEHAWGCYDDGVGLAGDEALHPALDRIRQRAARVREALR